MRPPSFWTRQDLLSQLAATLLTPIGWLYGASIAYRNWNTVRYRTNAKVVCIGNLTAGGTGKTPIALEIGRILIARGARPVFLSRGYGGQLRGPAFVAVDDLAADVGDEPLLLATIAPVIISRDRAAGARFAEKNGFDTIIMDDGHQNFSLAKDLSFIVVDAETGFGNNRMLPAGPLREPVAQGLKRADALVIFGNGTPAALALNKVPAFRAHLAPVPDNSWTGSRVIAFAGIGRPQKFFSTLVSIGAQIIEARPFGDHHTYTQTELAQLRDKASAETATLVTTEKDFVRLTRAEREGIVPLPVRVTFEDVEPLERLLDRLIPRGLPPREQ